VGVKPPPDPIYFETPEQLRDWFDANHATADELWIGHWKKSTGRPSLSWSETVDEALCVGWIDGVRHSVDKDRFTQRFTPRRPGSNWSLINVAKVEELTKQGRMRPAGRAAFEARRPDRTGVYSFERGEPAFTPEQERRFRANAKAWEWFQGKPKSYRRPATWWVISAKQEATRERRLTALIEDSAAGQTVRPLTSPARRKPG
jgi:uncharacterized protein YdeI (YjbR/CyaY-like superfamily)